MSYNTNQNIEFANSTQKDGFDRLRVSEVSTVFDSPLKHNDEALLWNTVTSGVGTSTSFNEQENVQDMSVSMSGDSVIRQSKPYFQLQTGKSHVGMAGVVFGNIAADVIKCVGFYDDDDGFFFEYSNTDIRIGIRTSVTGSTVTNYVPRSAWTDKLDGTGPSGLNLDFSKAQVLCFDISYTGFGRVRMGVFMSGKFYECFSTQQSNTATTNGLSTSSLPVRYEIGSSGGSSSMKQQASCVLVEGDGTARGIIRTVDTGINAVSASNLTYTPLIALRLKSSARKAQIIPISYSIVHSSTNTTLYYEIYLQTTVVGGAWNSVASHSIAEVNTTPISVSGGVKVASGYIPAKSVIPVISDFDSILNLVGNYDGTTDAIVIRVRGVDNSAPTHASLTFKEVY